MFFCAVSISLLEDRLPILLADLGGLRSSGSSTANLLRVGRPVLVGMLGFGAGTPKSSSSIESESESEFKTTCFPCDRTRLLALELADVCEVGGGSVSTDAMGASSTAGVFESSDIVCPAAEACVEVGWAAPVELGVGEPSSVLLSAVD